MSFTVKNIKYSFDLDRAAIVVDNGGKIWTAIDNFDPSVVVPEELPDAQYYVDAEGVTAYFQQYQVGPYAAGFVSATISNKEMLKYDFSDTTN